MVIEIRREYILVDGERKYTGEIFEYDRYDNNPSYLDLRRKPSLCKETIEFRNHSGRNLNIIGLNDWHATLKTGMGIIAVDGIMEYMSQYEI